MKYYFSIILSFISAFLFSQTKLHLKLKLKDDYFELGKYNSQSFPFYKAKDTVLILKNGEIVTRYQSVRLNIKVDSTTGNKVFIDLMGGKLSNGNLFMIADVNSKNGFKDDSIYILNTDKYFEKRSDYIKAWPEIKFDNLFDTEDSLKTPLCLKIRPVLFPTSGYKHFKSKKEVVNYKGDFDLQIFTYQYLSSDLSINNEPYVINLEIYPTMLPFYKNITDSSTFWIHRIAIYKKEKIKDSLIIRTSLAEILKWIRIGGEVNISGKSLCFLDISLKKDYIDVLIKDNVETINSIIKIDSIIGFSVKSMKTILLKKTDKIRLLFFTGSWCKPCRDVMDDVDLLYSRYGRQVEFITIANENSLLEAKNYYREHPVKWQFLYEELDQQRPNYLKDKFTVNAYPAFFLLDRNGNIMYKGVSETAIPDLQKKLQEIFHK